MRRVHWYVSPIAVGLLLISPACGAGEDDGARPTAVGDDAVTVTSFDFAESVVVAEIYSQALEAAGFRVERALSLGPREFVGPALSSGLVELVPDYAGTAVEFVSLGKAEPSEDPARNHRELLGALEAGSVTALAAAPAQDANTFVVTTETARRYGLTTLSDLRPIAGELTFGGPAECSTRRYCLAGLVDVYELRFDEVVLLDTGGPLTKQALRTGAVDVALLFTTDPSIVADGFVELSDDLDLQPAENITPLVHRGVLERFGDELVEAIDDVSVRLTTREVRQLNADIAAPGADIAAVATEWLRDTGPP